MGCCSLLPVRLAGLLVVGGVAAALLVRGAEAEKPAPVDFARDVRPILQAHCTQCHGAQRHESELRLDHRESALKGGNSGAAIVAGKSGESELVRRITSEDEFERMPPPLEGKSLSQEQIALIRRWIDEGAQWPDVVAGILIPEVDTDHWAFQPVRRPELPEVKDADWPRNEVDRIVLARLEAEGIAPSPEADRITHIRRLYYDLIGLPPAPEEVDEFVGDESPDAYERLVDRLLSSRHFGERWGRHWLDKARYADSDGYEKDNARPNAWLYRDWVIDAVNADMPFDRFTREQLAGDLLPDADLPEQLATAFHRQTLTNTEGGVDQEEFRIEAVFDRVATTGTVWLGLTVGCAQCHSHKYDPITQAEYYQLFAFFNNGDELTIRWPVSEEAAARHDREMPVWDDGQRELENRLTAVRKRLAEQLPSWEERIRGELATAEDPERIVPAEIAEILEVDVKNRNETQRQALLDHIARDDAEYVAVKSEIEQHAKTRPPDGYNIVRVITERAVNPRKSRILHRGSFLQPTTEVPPGVLQVLHDFQPRNPGNGPDRLDLANWIVDPANPLTPRVAVNHVWLNLFGRGIVATANDFGVRGEPPTHPELLDWLADEFQRIKWSRKALIRKIVTSATYRQSSRHRRELAEIDPQNRLLYRQNRVRVEGEIVRDLYLAASGLLSPKVGGPSVFPPMPADVAALTYANSFQWKNSEGEDRYRRGMYTFFKRTSPHPQLTAFDCPDANTTSVQRNRSNTPLQALTTLNNEVFVEASQALARRVLEADAADDAARITHAFRLCIARPPDGYEQDRMIDLLHAGRDYYAEHPDDAERLIGKHRPESVSAAEAAAWVSVARIILNFDEFITRE